MDQPQNPYQAPKDADKQPAAVSKPMLWGGRVMSGLVVVALVMSGVMKFVKPDGMDKDFDKLGWDMNLASALGVVEITCVVIYAIPQTSILGAILLTGYLGGATATHVRIIDSF